AGIPFIITSASNLASGSSPSPSRILSYSTPRRGVGISGNPRNPPIRKVLSTHLLTPPNVLLPCPGILSILSNPPAVSAALVNPTLLAVNRLYWNRVFANGFRRYTG